MSVNQLYANGRIAVMSTRLLGADKFTRLAESNTLPEAIKILSEIGYGSGASADNGDYETLLIAELDEALKILKELCSNRHAVNYFLARYDYLNAKVLMKCKYLRMDGLKYCYNEANLPPDKMQQAFVTDDYSMCTQNMAEACDAIDTEYAEGNRLPSVIDKTLDKAMFADMLVYANKCRFKYRFVKEMFVYTVDTSNLMSAYRVKRAGLDKSVYAEMLIDGGRLSPSVLLDLFDDSGKAADLDYDYKRFYALCGSDNVNLLSAESAQRARLFKFIKDNVDLTTIQPVLEYFFNKVNEIELVRRILIAVKSGADKDKIKDMLKNV